LTLGIRYKKKPRLNVVTQNVLGIRKIKKMKWHAHWILLGTKTTLELKNEVGPLNNFLPKFIWNGPLYKNLIVMSDTNNFVPNNNNFVKNSPGPNYLNSVK
jgi:hypothetical protein